jgi:filamentous hemagglutinin family protein
MASWNCARKFARIGWFSMLLAAMGAVHAEATFTGTGTTISGDMSIDAAQGAVRGGNVFHSFRVFNVLGGESATFTGADGIRNVISRVTGGTSDITGLKASIIDGPLSVAIPGANFFFINPNGVIIGANGFINASGSVYISTADALRLGDGGVFYADPARDSVLTTADPVAFGFLSASPAPITLDGPWLGSPYAPAPVPPGKTFALIGGDITIQAGIYGGAAIVAQGATVSLASVASAGDAVLLGSGAIDVSGFATLGHVLISGGSFIDVGDAGDAFGFFGNGASGSIYIRAGQLTLAPAGLLAQTFGDADGGVIDIAVRGDMVAGTDPESGIVSAILTGSYGGLGRGAGVTLDVGGKLTIADGSFLSSESYGPGAAGDIHIRAGAIEIRGQGPGVFTGISADNHDTAPGPSLSIKTDSSLDLLNGGFAGTRNFGPGTGGALTIDADSIRATGAIDPATGVGGVTLSLSTETVGGKAGDMTIRTRTLDLADGARISSSTGGSGDAGALNIQASERVDIDGGLSGIFTATSADATGHAGTLDVATPVLNIRGGVIDSSTVGDGNAGVVTVAVDTLHLAEGAQIRSFSGGFDDNNNGALVAGSGNAGSVNVVATGAVTISGANGLRPSGLLTETRGSGAGGDVQLQAASLGLTDGATISSSTLGSGTAGSVNVLASGTVTIAGGNSLRPSGLLTETQGSGAGGDLSLQASALQLLGGATISSSTRGGGAAGDVHVLTSGTVTISGRGDLGPSGLFAETRGDGAGGDVRVQAHVLTLADGGTVSSSSLGSGLAGNIDIRLGDSLDISGGAISTRALASDGGNISIMAPRLIRLVNGQITTSVENGTGGGGNIFIDPEFVLLQNSQVIANAFGGPGGNIRIVAGQLIADPATTISASSALGIDGAVNIDAPDTDVSAGLAVLPAAYLDASSLLRAGCSAARAGLSSLVEVGRGGLPPDPGGYLPSMDLGGLARGSSVADGTHRPSGAEQQAARAAYARMSALSIAGCGS